MRLRPWRTSGLTYVSLNITKPWRTRAIWQGGTHGCKCMSVAEVSSSSQIAHSRRWPQESRYFTATASRYLAALTDTSHSHFRYTAVFTIAHRRARMWAWTNDLYSLEQTTQAAECKNSVSKTLFPRRRD